MLRLGHGRPRPCFHRMLTGFDRIKRHLASLASSLPLPRKEQRRIVFLHVVFRVNSKTARRSINPLRWSLDLREIAYRCFINHHMPFPALPLGAELFISKARLELQRSQNSFHLGPIFDARLGFNADLVSALFPRTLRFVREHPSLPIFT